MAIAILLLLCTVEMEYLQSIDFCCQFTTFYSCTPWKMEYNCTFNLLISAVNSQHITSRHGTWNPTSWEVLVNRHGTLMHCVLMSILDTVTQKYFPDFQTISPNSQVPEQYFVLDNIQYRGPQNH